jgi:hypothetical protein
MDYSKMTMTELIDELCRLETIEAQELSMDGSGDCSDFIHNSFKPLYDKIENELNTRPEYHELLEELARPCQSGLEWDESELPF